MLETIIKWVSDHLVEAITGASVALVLAGSVIVRVRNNKTKVSATAVNNQIAGGDIKNADVKGSKNNINIK